MAIDEGSRGVLSALGASRMPSAGAEYCSGTGGYFRGTATGVHVASGVGQGSRMRRTSWAGAYIYGAAGNNYCPGGSVRIETEAACRTAAATAGMPVGSPFIKTDSIYPRGCYLYTWCSDRDEDGCKSYSYSVFFNPHPNPFGASDPSRKLLCAEPPGETGLVFTGAYQCEEQRATAARISVTAWPSAARIEFVPASARSPLIETCLLCVGYYGYAVCRVCSCAGEYTLTGVWMNETQRWALTPGVWLTNPCNYTILGFSGTIDVVAGLRRFSGRVVGGFGALCSTFSLMESTGTAPSSCASSGTLIVGVPTVPMARTVLSGTYHTLWYCMVPCGQLAATSAPRLAPDAALRSV
jgi:hypothetical protein